MTKLIAKHSVKSGGTYYAPGSEFDVSDADEVKALVDGGAAERKTRQVADDSDAGTKAADAESGKGGTKAGKP